MLLIAFCCAIDVMAQQKFVPVITTLTHQLGDDNVHIKLYQYGPDKDAVYINLHSDETTSVEAAKKLLETKGGLLIKLENGNKRNITFLLDGAVYAFDPNRIFSRAGIEHTLDRFKNKSENAIAEVEEFAAYILSHFPNDITCVIALHNNTEGNLSVNSYQPGNIYASDAKKVYANAKQDPDDFFLTTDSLLFEQLSREKYNTVWQDNLLVQQDGSLSVYCGEKNIRYLNCEAQHGKVRQHIQMLRVALKYIRPKSSKE